MKHKDYIPLPQQDGRQTSDYYSIIDWVHENAKDPKWSYSRTKSKYYRRALRPTVILGVYLSPEDAIAVRLKFNIKDLI